MTTSIRAMTALAFAAVLSVAPAVGQTTADPAPHGAPSAAATAADAQGAPAVPASDPPAAPVVDPHAASPAEHAEAGGDHAAAGVAGDHAEAGHEGGESLASFLGRLFNFAVLAGGIVYFLKTPLTSYLASRSEQIRADLVNAAATRDAATKELASIDAKMRGLPAELEALKVRGKEEMVAEQARIKAAADAERQRLVEQARLEIDQQTRAARRDLQEYAATLAVDVARARLSAEMTDADQSRLVDRYVAQVKIAHE